MGSDRPQSSPRQYFKAIYHITGTLDEARAMADDIRVEQTIEYPEDLVIDPGIRERILGRVAEFTALGRNRYQAIIEYPEEIAGRELTQLLNVLFGNISLKPGIRLARFELSANLGKAFQGPRFGREGIRALLGVPHRPLLCTALKPMGLGPRELAELAYKFALGGIDIIKDDHGLADQTFSPFQKRVSLCSEAVRRANAETGLRSLYFPNASAPADQLEERVRSARGLGAGGLVLAPGIVGPDTVRRIADDDEIALPIFSHPALQGAFTLRPEQGISHGALYGQINRLAGADACIFPSYGGRFSFTREDCRDLVDGATRPLGHIRPIFPVPAGGMSLERVPELLSFYGSEVILLIGGDLHRRGPDLVENCRKFRRLVEA